MQEAYRDIFDGLGEGLRIVVTARRLRWPIRAMGGRERREQHWIDSGRRAGEAAVPMPVMRTRPGA
jgi:hypothetical protein